MFEEIVDTQAFGMEVTTSGTVKRNVLICGRNESGKEQYLNSLTDAGSYARKFTGAIESEVDTHVVHGFTLVYKFSLIPYRYEECKNANEVFEAADVIVYVTGKDDFNRRKSITLDIMNRNYEESAYIETLFSHEKLLGKPILFCYTDVETCGKELRRFFSLDHLEASRLVKKAQILKSTTEDRVNLKKLIQLATIIN